MPFAKSILIGYLILRVKRRSARDVRALHEKPFPSIDKKLRLSRCFRNRHCNIPADATFERQKFKSVYVILSII